MTLPLSIAELIALSITQLQQHLQRGELAAREIADITLDAIAQRHPTLNAYTQVTGQRMQQEADTLDAMHLRCAS